MFQCAYTVKRFRVSPGRGIFSVVEIQVTGTPGLNLRVGLYQVFVTGIPGEAKTCLAVRNHFTRKRDGPVNSSKGQRYFGFENIHMARPVSTKTRDGTNAFLPQRKVMRGHHLELDAKTY